LCADEIARDNCHIADYFLEEVISRQPAAVRRFLLYTAVLDQLTASLCDSVVNLPAGGDRLPGTLQPVDSQMMLEYLQRNNHFVIAQDEQRSWFRYHHLFAEFLRRELAQKEPEMAPVLHHRASGWYAAHAMPEAAVDHALAAGDFATAIQLIEQVARDVTVRSELLMLQRWLDRVPADMLHSQPRLLTYRAAAHLLSGEPLETVQADLDVAMENGQDVQTQVIVLTLRGLIAHYQGRVAASRQLLEQSVSAMSDGQNIWCALAMDELALNHLRYGNRRQAEAVMTECLAIADRTDNVVNGVLALARLGELALLECRTDDARWLYSEALARATRDGHHVPIAGIACIGLGRLHLEHGELDEAVARLEEGVHRIHGWGDTMAIDGYLRLVAAQSLRQEWSAADAALQRAREISHSFDAMTIDDDLVELQQVDFWLAHGDDLAAIMWLNRQMDAEHSVQDAEETLSLSAIHKTMTMAKICLANGKPGTALSLLAVRSTVAAASLPQRIRIDLDLLEALVLYALGRMHTARTRFVRALEQAAAPNVILPFLEYAGPALSALLISAVQESAYRSFVIQLLERHDTRKSKQYGLSPTSQNTLAGPLLTARELEILTLISCGLKNSEIGAKLFIAPSTVKTHINNLYRKLDVHSRTRALARARQLELI
jgi:LuxR family maltose regulon positive regulatory protein